TPCATGNVVTSTMRKRRRLMMFPVLLVNVRRMSSVPKVELFGGSVAVSRNALGGWSKPLQPSSLDDVRLGVPSRTTGDDRFSGPGRPSRWPAPALVPWVSMKKKSAALLSVSTSAVVATPGVVWDKAIVGQLP